jgi:phosphoglycerate dehydrogenase-like enzyme
MSRSVLMLANLRRNVAGWAESLALLRGQRFEVDDPGAALDPGEATQRAAEVDAIVVGGTHLLGEDVLAKAKRLRVVSRQGVGMDNIDVAAATRLGVVVCNTAGCNADAVADHAFALLLHLTRDLGRLHALTRAGRGWDEGWPPTLRQLAGKSMAILGTGNIGHAVARRASAFGMRILAHDLVPDPALVERLGVTYLPLDDMLPLADVLTIHVPLTPLTRELIGADRLALLRPHALLINTARGGVVDEQALADAIRGGRLAGAGVDVHATEPRIQSPLFDLDRVVLTPHVGGSSVESWTAARMWAAENLIAFFEGAPRNVVNPEVVARAGPGQTPR